MLPGVISIANLENLYGKLPESPAQMYAEALAPLQVAVHHQSHFSEIVGHDLGLAPYQ